MFGSRTQETDWLIVGLGNPGEEYAATRHNAGFLAIDKLGEELGARYWKSEGGALTAKVSHHGLSLVLAKPQSFMNLSGGPVKSLCKTYSVVPERLIVVHDEMDLEPGTVRVKFGGGLAGHNGLKSINEKLQTPNFHRIRIGIGRPPGRMAGADYVLQPLRGETAELFAVGVNLGAEAAVYLASEGLESAQRTYNTRS